MSKHGDFTVCHASNLRLDFGDGVLADVPSDPRATRGKHRLRPPSLVAEPAHSRPNDVLRYCHARFSGLTLPGWDLRFIPISEGFFQSLHRKDFSRFLKDCLCSSRIKEWNHDRLNDQINRQPADRAAAPLNSMIFKDEIALRPQDSRQRRSQEGLDSGAQRVIQPHFDQSTHKATNAELQGAALTAGASEHVSSWIEEIKQVWSRGTSHALELARVIGKARNRLLHGEWTQVVKSLPFSKRKADMLVAVGKRFSWLHAQSFAHLPAGWSVLYQLAKLDRTVFEKLIQQEIIHPKLTLQDARELVARFNGRRRKRQSAGINIKRRLRQFCDYVERTLSQWKPEERELAKSELGRMLEQIDAGDGEHVGREVDDGRASHSLGRRIFPDAPRVVTSLNPKTRKTV